MDRQQAKQYVKSQMESYLLQKGLNPGQPFHCLNPDHPDRHPSMRLDRRRHKVHCFSCGADYDLFDLIGLDHGLTEPGEIFRKAYDLFGLEPDQDFPLKRPRRRSAARPRWDSEGPDYLVQCRQRLEQTDYPAQRGLSAATCLRFGLGYDPRFPVGGEGNFWAALIIPTGTDSFTARNTDPGADKDQRVRKRGASPIYNAQALWTSETPVLVVEGEIDVLSVSEAGGEAVGLGSTANVAAFLKLVESRRPLSPLLLALDDDEEGRRAEDRLAEGLGRLSAPFYRISPYGGCKDANEALLRRPGAFRRALVEAAAVETAILTAERETYLVTSAARHLDDFRPDRAGDAEALHLPTGFRALDEALEGGLFAGLYIMGGISSLGKTSLALQLADQLAESGREVLFFSLEMARRELMAKSLSRLTLLNSLRRHQNAGYAKTTRGLICRSRYQGYGEEERLVMAEALDQYASFAGRIFISEGGAGFVAAGLRSEVEKHLRHTGRPPVVMVDYLQILAAVGDRGTDKQNMDRSVLELKRLSRDFDIPVLSLSSFNRSSYREAATMEAFKESGAIEYSSDVLMGLQFSGAGDRDFDALAAKERNPREVELVILKNRHGPAGRRISYEYYPMFNFFKEK